MAERWTLNRAGIINVFQYEDETIHFGGGRLLLRGVNGSGKSSAMNMLLPFLLEADVRRIDAAGEQSAVLRSWMLSGREEPQPIGYLWIEFELARRGREPEYRVCGCGIKANRSTEKVTTWWFITPRRPGHDLALVTSRHPLAPDALRSELGPAAVFSQEQRPAYRDAVRQQLFGGADLDRHLRLLHEVRSPRVGDRITTNDLQRYLLDALPQLSERAIEDAALPLENLEEFRANVENLTRTARTLDSLADVYRSYARDELRSRAHAARRDRGLRRVEGLRPRHRRVPERDDPHDRPLLRVAQMGEDLQAVGRPGLGRRQLQLQGNAIGDSVRKGRSGLGVAPLSSGKCKQFRLRKVGVGPGAWSVVVVEFVPQVQPGPHRRQPRRWTAAGVRGPGDRTDVHRPVPTPSASGVAS